MKKILLIVSLGMFLGVASVSAAEMNTVHKNVRTEQKIHKSGTQKKVHHKRHTKGMNKDAAKSTKKGSLNQ